MSCCPTTLGEAYPPDYRVNQIEQRADEVQGLLHLLCAAPASAKRTANQLKSFEFLTPDERSAVEATEAEVRRELGDVLEAIDFDKTVLGGLVRRRHDGARRGAHGRRGRPRRLRADGGTTSTSPRFGRAASNEQRCAVVPLAHERGSRVPPARNHRL